MKGDPIKEGVVVKGSVEEAAETETNGKLVGDPVYPLLKTYIGHIVTSAVPSARTVTGT